MINYREILRLHSLGYSQRRIKSSVRSSHQTVKSVLEKAKAQGISWPLEDDVTNAMLDELLSGKEQKSDSPYAEPDFAYIYKELSKKGVTLTLLWQEYCDKCRANGQQPYMSTQFGDKYRRWARVTKATMRITHKPGDAMQVDWAGETIPYYNAATGEECKVYLFVAALPCSCYIYVEACGDMKQENWLLCHVHAYEYFGGVARLLIPDNLKTGVIANTRYETRLNESYRELAEYYGAAIVPARVRKPQDKSFVEKSVGFSTTWITAAMRERKFFSLAEVKEAVAERLEIINTTPFQKRPGNRREAYLSEEKEFMLPLPIVPYEPAVWKQATVRNDYLISDGQNKYSVSYDLIGEQVQLRLTKNTVEIFFKGERVASHQRLIDELSIAKANGELKDTIKAYAKLDLLILDEWLIRRLSYNEAYDLLEIVEARENRSMIFCTQYETEGWYSRIHPDDSPISEAIMDRIIHNSYIVAIDGKCSMRERHGLNTEVAP